MALLISLPSSYTTLVTALEAKGDELSLSFVQQALINEEQKRDVSRKAVTLASSKDSALQVRKEAKRFFKGRCYKCNREGHKSFECTQNSFKYKKAFKQNEHNAKTAENQGENTTDLQLFLMNTGQTRKGDDTQWVMDSGASQHMTANKHLLTNYPEFDVPETVRLGDGHTVEAYGSGQVKITVRISQNKDISTQLDKVLFVPKLACNLFSVRAVTQKGYTVQFGHSCCWIKDSNGKVRGKGRLTDNMYMLITDEEISTRNHEAKKAENESPHELDLWHQRLGHINENQLLQTVKNSLIKGINLSENDKLKFCEGCVEGKMSLKPFKSVRGIKTTRKLQLVHSDVCGPMSVQSFTGKLYFVTFIDDYSRCVKVYFIRKKSEVLAKLKEFEAAATNEAGCKIGTLRTDNGGEYTSRELEDYLKKKGIKHETSVSYSPQQNGVAERMNRTLLESAREMVYHAGLSKEFWAEAINTAAFIRNRVVTVTTGQSPYERWYGKVPDMSQFRVFGCIAYAHIPEAERRKLDMKANKLRFLGYSDTQKGYRLFDVRNNKVIIKRDVIFNESDFGHQKESVEVDVEKEVYAQNKLVNEGTPKAAENDFSKDGQVLPRRSQRSTKGVSPARFDLDDNVGASEATHVAFHAGIKEPATIEEAFNSEYSKESRESTDSE